MGRGSGVSNGRHRQVHGPHSLAILAAIAAIVVVVTWVRWTDGNRSSRGDESAVSNVAGTALSDSSVSPPASSLSGAPSASRTSDAISLVATVETATQLEAVRLIGEYAVAEPGTMLRVQVRYPDRGWVSFPLPTVVDDAGRFTTHVELGRRGENELRVIEPDTDVTSDPVVIWIR